MNTAEFFQAYYDNAKVNCILIMDPEGMIIKVNKGFTNNFGYKNDEINGQHFSILFTDKDRQVEKPHHELKKVLASGQANDENFMVHQNGSVIWCTGESVLVPSGDEHYIVKDIMNLQTRKQMKLLLTDPEELIDTIFHSSDEIPLMILDGAMRIQKVNSAFKKLFDIQQDVVEHAKLSDLKHPFWDAQVLKNELRTLIVSKVPITNSFHTFLNNKGESIIISIKSKCVQNQGSAITKFYIMFEEVSDTSN